MEKLSMGEYGFVVWAAYGVATVVLVFYAWTSWRALQKAQKTLEGISE